LLYYLLAQVRSSEIGSKLDFIHLNINKKQGKLGLTLHHEVAYASPANRIYHDPGNL